MIILGIDPGLATIGFGVIKKDTILTPLDYGVITTPKDMSLPKRLEAIDGCMTEIIAKYQPDAISIEELFFSKNVSSALPVAHARGVILLNAVRHSTELFQYTPSEVKLAVTGMGNAVKQQMQYMVKQILRLKDIPKPDDAGDALALAICHAHSNLTKRYDYV